MITKINQFKKILENNYNIKLKILQWLNKFPSDATKWSEATDELPTIHKQLANVWYEFSLEDNYNYFNKQPKYDYDYYILETKPKTPSEFNTHHKNGINILLDVLNDEHIEEVYNDYSHWIDGSVYEKNSAKQNFISDKIRTLMDEGKPHKQAVAIAISMWDQKQKKKKTNESIDNKSHKLANNIIYKARQYMKELDDNELDEFIQYIADAFDLIKK